MLSKIKTFLVYASLVVLGLSAGGTSVLAEGVSPVTGALTVFTTQHPEGIAGGSSTPYAVTLTRGDQLTSLNLDVTDADGDLNLANTQGYKIPSNEVIGSFMHQGLPSNPRWTLILSEPMLFTMAGGNRTFGAFFPDVQGNTANFNLTVQVQRADQTVSFDEASPLVIPYNQTLFLSATSSVGLPIVFSKISGPAILSGSTLSNIGAGGTYNGEETVIRAEQAGDDEYNPAFIEKTFTSTKGIPIITLEPVINMVYDGQQKEVSFLIDPPALKGSVVVTYNGAEVPPVQIGSYEVVATFPSGTKYVSSTAVGTLNILPNRVIYRFYKPSDGTHFYTASAVERDTIISRWPNIYQYEGIAWTTTTTTLPVYRFYNMKTGTHFYTVNEAEKATVIARWSSTYQYEGIGWNDSTTSSQIYRFYNVKTGTHFYTASDVEKATVISRWPTIYKFEGVAW